MEQVWHHTLFQNAFGSQEVFVDVNPDDVFVISKFDDLGIDFFVDLAAGIFVILAAGKDGVKQDFRFGITLAQIVENKFDTRWGFTRSRMPLFSTIQSVCWVRSPPQPRLSTA